MTNEALLNGVFVLWMSNKLLTDFIGIKMVTPCDIMRALLENIFLQDWRTVTIRASPTNFMVNGIKIVDLVPYDIARALD